MKHSATFAALTLDQKKALVAFIATHGRTWRSALRAIWDAGTDANQPLIRQIRNNVGPSAIALIRTDEVTAYGATLNVVTAAERYSAIRALDLLDATTAIADRVFQ